MVGFPKYYHQKLALGILLLKDAEAHEDTKGFLKIVLARADLGYCERKWVREFLSEVPHRRGALLTLVTSILSWFCYDESGFRKHVCVGQSAVRDATKHLTSLEFLETLIPRADTIDALFPQERGLITTLIRDLRTTYYP